MFTDSLTVSITKNKETYKPYENIRLTCQVSEDTAKSVQIVWMRDGKPLPSENRFKQTEVNELLIEGATGADSGEYTCTATHGQDEASASISVTVEGGNF